MSLIRHYGQELVNKDPTILSSLKIGFYENKDSQNYVSAQINLQELQLPIILENYSIKIVEKEHRQGFFMKWHMDDGQVIKHNKNTLHRLSQLIINEKKSIHFQEIPPKYSLIYYLSSYEEDFEGGLFEFCDGRIIQPEKHKYIFFDSRYIHCVHPVKSGIRKNILIKFYEKKIINGNN